jgi:trk system potassium uptake protein TrkH
MKGPNFVVDGLFESASGFTTTGASIFTDVEREPGALLLWRALTQWLGGMGIIVLGIAVLPKLAVGGMELLGAEAPGPIAEKIRPRIAQTAKSLWGIYTLFTALETLVLMGLGLNFLDAVAQSFTTMATGGFATRNASIAAFGSPAVEWTVTFFMFLAGANFALHFQWIRGKVGIALKDPEFRTYFGVLVGGMLFIVVNLVLHKTYGLVEAFRLAAFQVVSVITTTGFATADYDLWPHFSKALLFVAMFVGGCAGSTGGSVKVVRILIVLRKIAVDLRRMVRPHAVLPLHVGLCCHHFFCAVPPVVRDRRARLDYDGDGPRVEFFRFSRLPGQHWPWLRVRGAGNELCPSCVACKTLAGRVDDRRPARALHSPRLALLETLGVRECSRE